MRHSSKNRHRQGPRDLCLGPMPKNQVLYFTTGRRVGVFHRTRQLTDILRSSARTGSNILIGTRRVGSSAVVADHNFTGMEQVIFPSFVSQNKLLTPVGHRTYTYQVAAKVQLRRRVSPDEALKRNSWTLQFGAAKFQVSSTGLPSHRFFSTSICSCPFAYNLSMKVYEAPTCFRIPSRLMLFGLSMGNPRALSQMSCASGPRPLDTPNVAV